MTYKSSTPVSFELNGIRFETGVYNTAANGKVHPQVKLFADGVKIAEVNMFYDGEPWYDGSDKDLKDTLWFIEKNFNKALAQYATTGDSSGAEVSDEWWEKVLDALRKLQVVDGKISIPR